MVTVVRWLAEAAEDPLFISVVALAQLRKPVLPPR
jgi:hypothetical protein